MKNTLIIGIAGTGKTQKLKEMLNDLPQEVRIMLCEAANHDKQEFRHHDTMDLLKADSVEVTVSMTKMLVKKPSLMVIEELHHYTNVEDSYEIPVYATMQVATIEEANRILKEQQITIQFEDVIVCPQYPGVTISNNVMGGLPVIANTRVLVSTIVSALKEGASFDEIGEDYDLTPQQIIAALTYVETLLAAK